MRWILGLVGALVGVLVGEEEGLFIGLGFGMLIGWAIERERRRTTYLEHKLPQVGSFEQRATARILELTERVAQLERSVAALRAAASGAAQPAEAPQAQPQIDDPESMRPATTSAVSAFQEFDERGYPLYSSPEAARARAGSEAIAARAGTEAAHAQTTERALADVAEAPASTAAASVSMHGPTASPAAPRPSPALEALRELLFGGNTVVRIGILVLTVGLGLLAKYAADHSYFPLELRLAFAAAVGVGLIALGYRLHEQRPGFSTALQGGGIAALYLVTFFAFYSYALLPASLTLPLLVAIAALSSVLAIAQDAQQLAVFGALGGFLAPILASTGGGSHIALFSYYALLNAALLGVALFRSWRILNWTGFVFTFGVASAWGALKYEPEHMFSASAFLALFFVFYVLDGTLFALRQPAERRGTIDTTLTFGTPLATLALAGGLFRETPLYLAFACAAMAAVYLGAARAVLTRSDRALRTLSQAYVAIGVGVATLAIPFALENALATALAWSVEATGLIWVGSKQERLRTRIAGYLLFLGSLFALLARVGDASKGGGALFCALIAGALGFSAAYLERRGSVLRTGERYAGHVLSGLGLVLFLAALHLAAEASFVPSELHDLCLLSLIAVSVLAFEAVGVHTNFAALRRVARFALPYLLLNLPSTLSSTSHPFADFAWVGWLASIAASYRVLWQQQREPLSRQSLLEAVHASGAWLAAALSAVEASFLARDVLGLSEGWVDGLTLAAPLWIVALAWARAPSWPVAAHSRAYAKWSAWPITLLVCFAALLRQAESTGNDAPLPYLPLLNPLDLAHALALAALLALARAEAVRSSVTRRVAVWGAAASGFVLLNAAVVHTAHHWADVRFGPWEVPRDPLVQASFSILWTLLALIAMVAAQRSRQRPVWIVGAALLGCVVLKLFLLDLAALSSVTKIVTFLAVGVLLLLVGYFAPVPPAKQAEEKTP